MKNEKNYMGFLIHKIEQILKRFLEFKPEHKPFILEVWYIYLIHYTEIESCEESDEVLPLSLAQTKLDLLLEPSNPAADVESEEFQETVPEIDTLEAHSELIKMREKLRVEKETEKDQVCI